MVESSCSVPPLVILSWFFPSNYSDLWLYVISVFYLTRLSYPVKSVRSSNSFRPLIRCSVTHQGSVSDRPFVDVGVSVSGRLKFLLFYLLVGRPALYCKQ